jgi:hypothetical protein
MRGGSDSLEHVIEAGVKEFGDAALTEVKDGMRDPKLSQQSDKVTADPAPTASPESGPESTPSSSVRKPPTLPPSDPNALQRTAISESTTGSTQRVAPQLFPGLNGPPSCLPSTQPASSLAPSKQVTPPSQATHSTPASHSMHSSHSSPIGDICYHRMAPGGSPSDRQSITEQEAHTPAYKLLPQPPSSSSDATAQIQTLSQQCMQLQRDAAEATFLRQKLSCEAQAAKDAERRAVADLAGCNVTIAELKAEMSEMSEYGLGSGEVEGMRAQVRMALNKVKEALAAKEAAAEVAEASRGEVVAAEEARRAAEGAAQVRCER